ncbi:hypothetical protein AGMMS49960_06550 [Betaproteobacteria bacterium]|nr:hypothetical protein AGMMS49543_26450 [Betaproteobacteria bacterium]GHT99910.1 hypothetical protein AGMMS49960_06550 [Betaproteobacteria bacterium]GHU23406.1 hypothetical protein AGMMS50243_24760 [Betaproteobacteria bacterium]
MNKHFTLTAVAPVPPVSLKLKFADGHEATVDLTRIIESSPVLAPLNNPAVLACAALGEGGLIVSFGDDDMLELGADNLRARAIEQAGGYSHEFLWNWMAKHSLTLDEAARAIGISRRMLAYYRSGKNPVPKTVALACLGWETCGKKAA